MSTVNLVSSGIGAFHAEVRPLTVKSSQVLTWTAAGVLALSLTGCAPSTQHMIVDASGKICPAVVQVVGRPDLTPLCTTLTEIDAVVTALRQLAGSAKAGGRAPFTAPYTPEEDAAIYAGVLARHTAK